MPGGTRPELVQQAAREFAQVELRGHRWVMVLHEHQANPHVHLSVRAESTRGERLNRVHGRGGADKMGRRRDVESAHIGLVLRDLRIAQLLPVDAEFLCAREN